MDTTDFDYYANTSCNASNKSSGDDTIISIPDDLTVNYVYCIFVTVLVVTSLIAMFVNVVVFASVYWVRRPMPPILKISLSLAAADASSSSTFAISLFINTYLPSIGVNHTKWLQIAIEMIRLSGILITVAHLLALSLNHYIGILKPLHYNSIVTRRKVTGVIILLWICPTVFIVCLFTIEADDDFWTDSTYANNTTLTFMDTFKFRMTFSSFFFVPIAVMVVSYTHILVIVRKQQNVWKHLSRCGSTKWTGRKAKSGSGKANREQKQLEGNIRAIYTTLLILGSCVIGWMPALLIFVLMCESDCLIHGEELSNLNMEYVYEVMSLRLAENMLVILKMLANPIIYSIRMKEIQEGTKRMYFASVGVLCGSRRNENGEYRLASRKSPKSSSLRNNHLRASLNSSGRTSHVTIGRSELVTTLL